MTEFTPIASTLGGLLIGTASATLLLLHGRVAGISGIVGALFDPSTADRSWRVAFVAGLLATGAIAYALVPASFGDAGLTSPAGLVVAGLLVGVGTRLGGGCTSGHGVCGMSRLAPRSLTATALFMVVAIITVFITRHLVG